MKTIIATLILQLAFLCVKAQMREIYLDSSADNQLLKISMFKPNEGYIAFTDWIGYTADSGRTYTRKFITRGNVDYGSYSVNLTFGFGISGVKAFSKDTLVVYGNYGAVPAIIYSTNQGNTFKLVYQSQLNLQQLTDGITDMAFPVDKLTGFATEADRIIKTTDGGRTWRSVLESPNSFFSFIDALDRESLVVFSTNYATPRLLQSINGGATWQPINIPAGQINYANFITTKKGWLSLADPYVLYYTVDRGNSWTPLNDPILNPFYSGKMHFINDSTGYSISGNFHVYKTFDSGKVWEVLPQNNNYSYLGYGNNDLSFFNNNQFWAGGGHGFLEITTNAGGTPLPRALFKVDTTGENGPVNLINLSRRNYSYSWFVNGALVSTSFNASYHHDISRQSDSIVLKVNNGINTDTLMKVQYYMVPNLPLITSFAPKAGGTGAIISITGSGLDNVSRVTFGGVAADSFNVISSTQINAIVGRGASGNVSVTDVHGSYSLNGFTYLATPSASPPVITSVTPSAGPIGTTVTISGKNFSSTADNNIIWFGGTKANIISADANRLVCKVPAGASFEPISVLNTVSNLSGHSLKPFNLTFADSSNFTGNSWKHVFSLSSPKYIGAGSIFGKDMDGDGKPDLVATVNAYGGDSTIILRNISSDNNFAFVPGFHMTGIAGGLYPGQLQVGDLDNDGMPDLLYVRNDSYLKMRRNTSTPGQFSFDSVFTIACNGATQDSKIDDIDQDGRNDLVVSTWYKEVSNVAVIRNTGSRGNLSFGVPKYYPTPGADVNGLVATGDLDGDGKNDIVLFSGSVLKCFRNLSSPGNIVLESAQILPVGALFMGDLILADLDGDGKLDIIVTSVLHYYQIYKNVSTPGHIAFITGASYPAERIAVVQAGCVANFSGSVLPDFTANGGQAEFSFAKNISKGDSISFDSPVSPNGGYYNSPYTTNSADFNLDGKTDVLVATSTGFFILENVMGDSLVKIMCDLGSTEIGADLAGTKYQWQQNTGSGFKNISDNSTFYGTTQASLYISRVPYAWNGYQYRCIVDNHKTSTFVLQIHKPFNPAISIRQRDSVICYGNKVTFIATVKDKGSVSNMVTWFLNGYEIGPNDTTMTWSRLNEGDQIRAILRTTDSCYNYRSDTSNSLIVHFSGTQPTVVIQASDTVICSGTNVIFKVLSISGSFTPTYSWRLNDAYVGQNADSYSRAGLRNGDQVKVWVSGDGCTVPAFSNTITIKVNPSHSPSLVIKSTADSICSGSAVTFTALASDTGSIVKYIWRKNNVIVGTNSHTYTDDKLSNTDLVWANISTNVSCAVDSTAKSNVKNIYVFAPVTITGSVSGNTSVTQGDSVNLKANISSPGLISYQWQDSTVLHKWQNLEGAVTNSLLYKPLNTGDRARSIFSAADRCAGTVFDTSNILIFSVQIIPIADSNYSVKYYPNPVSTSLHLDSLNLDDHWTTFSIFDERGNKMLMSPIQNKTNVTIDIQKLSNGLYIGELINNTGRRTRFKFIKIH